MRPPICVICKKRFSPSDTEGGLVYFKLSEEEVKSNERFKERKFVGHPKGREWFCEKHIEQAKENKHLTFKEALQKMKDSSLF